MSQRGDSGEREIETETSRLIIYGWLSFIALFVGVGAWLILAQFSGAVIASGVVTVVGKPKTVQHLDGGIVSELRVENGDLVDKDTILLRLEDTVLKSNLRIYQRRLQEAVATRDRLLAEQYDQFDIAQTGRELTDLGLDPDKRSQIGQRVVFGARRLRVRGQIEQLEEKVEQFRRQTLGIQSGLSAKQNQLHLLETEYQNLSQLADQGYAAKNRVMRHARDISALEGQISIDEAELARIDNLVTKTRIQMSQVKAEFFETVVTELQSVEQEINDLVQQLTATREQLHRVDLKAPVSGTVHQLSIFTEGGVITAGAPVMQIVPHASRLEFEVKVAPVSIDQVFVGQSAKVTFSAFTARTTPQLDGRVRDISPDSITEPDTGASYYRVYVDISEKELARLGKLQLVPGMPIEVFLTTESRSPMDYLLQPLTDNVKRAMRED